MKKQVVFKTVLCGMVLYSALLVGKQAMAADKVVVVPLSSSKVYTFGNNNLFVGDGAGNHTMSGANNTGVGYGVLRVNTYGDDNTGMGFQALYSNTSGDGNTGYGAGALYNNTSGIDNTALGKWALIHNTYGVFNTAIGAGALYANTSGDYNTAIGYRALNELQHGDCNTAIGSDALLHNTNGNNNTAIGQHALENTTGNDNNAGNNNTAIGIDAGSTNTIGSNNTFVGMGADVSAAGLINATAIGAGATVTANNRVRIGNDDVTHIQGKVAFTTTSDKRQKKDIQDITRGLEFIKALRPVEYRMIRKEGEDRLNFGFIAQDIEALLGDKYNILDIGPDKDRSLSLRYTDFIAPMVKAMQEQQGIIEGQQKSIEEMKQKSAQQDTTIVTLRSELEELKMEIKAIKSHR